MLDEGPLDPVWIIVPGLRFALFVHLDSLVTADLCDNSFLSRLIEDGFRVPSVLVVSHIFQWFDIAAYWLIDVEDSELCVVVDNLVLVVLMCSPVLEGDLSSSLRVEYGLCLGLFHQLVQLFSLSRWAGCSL